MSGSDGDVSKADSVDAAVVPASRRRYGWPSIVVAIVFGLLYAYILWDAIGNLVQLPQSLGSANAPWWLLIVDVALPVLVFAAVWLLGRRHGILNRGLFFLIGLTVLSCSTVGSIVYVQLH